jgi:nucleoside-diphosphate-sugar epimerase
MTQTSPSLRSKRAKYIVTGGAGFIGSHLVEALLAQHAAVIVLDNFSAGLRENLPKDPKTGTLAVYDVDITDWSALKKLIDSGVFKGAAGVFHVAAQARIQPSIHHPRETFDANALGTLNVLEMMRATRIDCIVYSASSSSYGLINKSPLKEDMPSHCLNPYAVTKLIGEELCKAWGNIYGIPNICLKYFNVYGPRSPIHLEAYSPVIGLFFKQALQDNEPLSVVGDGEQKRDFTHVDDVVRANIWAMTDLVSEGFDSVAEGQTINIGTGSNYTIKELAQKVQGILKDVRPNLQIQHIPARPGEARETLADISDAKTFLGWKPEISLDDALKSLKPYYLELFNV